MDTPTPIANRVGDVERLFHEIDGGQVSGCIVGADEVNDVRDRFRLWAGNIGARNAPESKFSLETRLASARELLEQVIDLLSDLTDALEDLLDIVTGRSENRILQTDPLAEKDEAHDILDVASECIRSLLRISILIRKATPRDRFDKATQSAGAKTAPFLGQFDINHVAERFPKLRRPESKWLCKRLGQAITKRRQFLRYARQHRSRISGDIEVTEEVEEEKATESILAKNAFLVSHDTTGKSVYSPAVSRPGSVSEGAYTRPSTKASTLDVAKLALLTVDTRPDDDTKSYVSASSSFHITGSGEGTLRLPSLFEVSKSQPMFECPFCFGIETISDELEWRQHAFQDLRAYVCTLGRAECDNCFFGNSRTWFEHEMQCHRRTWLCIICQAGPFQSSQEMEEHTIGKHHDLLGQESQIQTVVDASRRYLAAIPARDCPFCDEWAESLRENTDVPEGTSASQMVITVEPTQFRRHVAFHQEQLALFAIPRTTHDDIHESDSGSSPSGELSHHSLDSTTRGDSDDGVAWVPDPPLLVAAADGKLDEVEALLKDGADPTAKGETWGDLWEAAGWYQDNAEPRIQNYTREVGRLASLYYRAEWGDVFPGKILLGIRAQKWGTEKGDHYAGWRDEARPIGEEAVEKEAGIPIATTNPKIRPPCRKLSEGDAGYEYTNPSSLVRYDLENPRRLRSHVADRGFDRSRHTAPDTNPHLLHWSAPQSDDTDTTGLDELRKYYAQKGSPARRLRSSSPESYDFREGPRSPFWHRRRVSIDGYPRVSESLGPLIPRVDRESRYEHRRPVIIDPPAMPHPGSPTRTSHREDPKPIKGILKQPTPQFPEDPEPFLEGVAPQKYDASKIDIPKWARWTRISRKLVNPEALTIGKERFEVRDDFVTVLRVLSKEEIQEYADATAVLRERRRQEWSKKTVDNWVMAADAETTSAGPASLPGQPKVAFADSDHD